MEVYLIFKISADQERRWKVEVDKYVLMRYVSRLTQSNLQTIRSSVERKLPTPSKDPPLEFIILSSVPEGS
jgi:hypothetical protein